MAKLIIHHGPHAGREFVLDAAGAVIGRTVDSSVHLPSNAVSRRHAKVLFSEGQWLLEDLGSSNGTLLNGQRVRVAQPLADGDELRFCEYVLTFRDDQADDDEADCGEADELTPPIRERVEAAASNEALFAENPQEKLRTLLLLAQSLGQTTEPGSLLDKLLQHLLQLLPLADRGLAVLCEGSQLVVRRSATAGKATRISPSAVRCSARPSTPAPAF